MTLQDVMTQLETLGTAQARKTYARHGAGPNVFGVSVANLNKLQKKIGQDHTLARQLWNTCNLDAQWLATMIADPARMDSKEADAWAENSAHHEHLLGGYLANLLARAPSAGQKMAAWMKSADEFTRACGYNLLGARLRNGDATVTDDACRTYLRTIEKEIHRSPNRARYSMNGALIGIGVYRPNLTAEALAAAGRIGTVDVDHGQTACQTPDAVPYIRKSLARKAATAR